MNIKQYKKYIEIAYNEAKKSLREGNKGFGTVIIRENDIIAFEHDTDISDNDSTSHAEIKAIKTASKKIGKDLSKCEIISTHEPCPMCTGAIIWSKIPKILYSVSIEDSIKLGRTMVNLRAKEIVKYAPWKIEIIEGLYKDKCIKLYDEQIRNQIKIIQSVKEDFNALEKFYSEKRVKWYNSNIELVKSIKGNDIEKAYYLLLFKLGISKKDAPIVKKTKNSITFHSINFCPTVVACEILELDTRKICKEIFEKSTEVLLQRLNPRLRFTRNYDKLRPYTKYCEETIYLEN